MSEIIREALTQKWERAAWEFGTSARANNEPKTFTRDCRIDIVAYYPSAEKWMDVPAADQERMYKVFYAGYEAESKNH